MNSPQQLSLPEDGHSSPTEACPPHPSLALEIRGYHIPALKNSKMILGIRKLPNGLWKGNPFIATKTEYKKLMERITQDFVSQFISSSRTTEVETRTTVLERSWIVSRMPLDDSWQWVPEIRVTSEKVEPGMEGATIIIERIG